MTLSAEHEFGLGNMASGLAAQSGEAVFADANDGQPRTVRGGFEANSEAMMLHRVLILGGTSESRNSPPS